MFISEILKGSGIHKQLSREVEIIDTLKKETVALVHQHIRINGVKTPEIERIVDELVEGGEYNRNILAQKACDKLVIAQNEINRVMKIMARKAQVCVPNPDEVIAYVPAPQVGIEGLDY